MERPGEGLDVSYPLSLGLERLLVLMEERGMLADTLTSTRVWVTVFDAACEAASLQAVTAMRAAGVPAEVSLVEGRLGKQLKAADKRGVRWVVIAGPDEVAAGVVKLRDLRSGQDLTLSLEEAVAEVAREG